LPQPFAVFFSARFFLLSQSQMPIAIPTSPSVPRTAPMTGPVTETRTFLDVVGKADAAGSETAVGRYVLDAPATRVGSSESEFE
jgi:hypothetical protein